MTSSFPIAHDSLGGSDASLGTAPLMTKIIKGSQSFKALPLCATGRPSPSGILQVVLKVGAMFWGGLPESAVNAVSTNYRTVASFVIG